MKKTKHAEERKSRGNWITKSIVVLIVLGIAFAILKIAPNYKNEEITDRINVIINNNNITNYLKKDVYIDEAGTIYLSKQDIDNFFDKYIEYDEKYNQIITTYGNKVAAIVVGENEMEVNSSTVRISAPVIQMDDTYYLPMSEMEDVYDMEIEYRADTQIVTIDSMDRKQIKADVAKNMSVKSRTKVLSRTVDKVEQGEKIIVIDVLENGWAKIRTERGKIGYVKEKNIANQIVVREDMDEEKKLEKVSLVWDYYSEYATAPDRTGEHIEGINVVSPTFFALERLGEGEIIDKAGEEGIAYVSWAKENGYKVWGLFANEGMIETTSQIMRDYKLREKTINKIVELAVQYNLDGINIDFENMYKEDVDLFTRFIIELYPRVKQCGMTLSVDVTAPDGGDTWSLCFDRYNIAENSDYIIFMAYDQYGQSSTKPGPTAGYDWTEVSLKKFVRDIESNKIILGIPFYTRLWREYTEQNPASSVVSMKNIDNALNQYFSGIEKIWDEGRKQYYVERVMEDFTYKMWIEDEETVQGKLDMAQEYKLGGVAFWVKDMEKEDVWINVKEYLEKDIEQE